MTTTTTTQLDLKEARASISSSATSRRTSVTSSTSTLCVPNTSTSTSTSTSTFYPTRTLSVNANGIGAFRLPIPSRQTEITISNPDGSDAYISTRDKLWSGNSVLSHPKVGNLIRTDYFFGPNREPILRLLQTSSVLPDEIKVSGQWTSRTTRFIMPDGQEYEWAYAKEKSDGKLTNLLILRAVNVNVNANANANVSSMSKSTGTEKGEQIEQMKQIKHRRIAQLVRGVETRTAGSSRCTAGNGGELQMEEGELETEVVVATCLMMLKKEMDRRRLIQFCVIGGAGGGS